MKNFRSFLIENDTAADVTGAYKACREEELYSRKDSVDKVRKDFSACLNDVDDTPVFWLALAFAMAERSELTKSVLKNALIHLDSFYFKDRYAEPFGFVNEIEEIKSFLESNIGPANTQKSKPPKKSIWKINDCYAFQLKSEKATELGVHGRFLIIHYVGSSDWEKKTFPIVHLFITTDDTMPDTAEKISFCIPIPTRTYCTPYTYRFRTSGISHYNEENGFLYLGNFENISFPEETIETNAIFCPPLDPKHFEQNSLSSIEPFGIGWLQKHFL